MRRQGLECVLETNLVVAFARASVGYGGSAFLQGDLHLSFGNDWTRKRCAQQILVLVHGTGLDGFENVVAQKFFAQIFDDNF